MFDTTTIEVNLKSAAESFKYMQMALLFFSFTVVVAIIVIASKQTTK